MKGATEIEIIGSNAVRNLRKNRLAHGQFFMINVNHLPSDHCYLEFPTGSIKLAVVKPGSKDFTIVRELEEEEAGDLRKRFNFD